MAEPAKTATTTPAPAPAPKQVAKTSIKRPVMKIKRFSFSRGIFGSTAPIDTPVVNWENYSSALMTYPYINKIIENEKQKQQISGQDILSKHFEEELSLFPPSETEREHDIQAERFWGESESGGAYHIWDYENERLSCEHHFKAYAVGDFSTLLQTEPKNVTTRIVIIGVTVPASFFRGIGDGGKLKKPPKTPTLPIPAVINTLGTTFDLPFSFFEQIICTEEFLVQGQGKTLLMENEALQGQDHPSWLDLSFQVTGQAMFAPRLWIRPVARRGSSIKTVLLFSNHILNHEPKGIAAYEGAPRMFGSAAPKSYSHDFEMAMEKMRQFTKSEIESGNKLPIEFLIPHIELLHRFVVGKLVIMREELQEWFYSSRYASAAEMGSRDEDLSQTWHYGRVLTEDFENIYRSIKEYAEITLSSVSNKSQKFLAFQRRQLCLLESVKATEGRIRDTIQINIGSLSLQESRKSIQQADSVGRISFLGFVFLPTSLVMSFYGMNINEITGSGASWRVFLVSLAATGFVVFIVCALIWRDSKRFMFIGNCFIMPGVLITIIILTLVYETWIMVGRYCSRDIKSRIRKRMEPKNKLELIEEYVLFRLIARSHFKLAEFMKQWWHNRSALFPILGETERYYV